MAELIYSLNGKYFKDYGVIISTSDGLFDGLKPKKQNTYDWPEYSGINADITQQKRFETRKFTLTGFVKGTDWNDMLNKFWEVFGDLNNPGRQRLLVDPFGIKTLVYDVTLEDTIDIKKSFRDGVSYATFTIKLVEQKPIKKILYTDKSSLELSFTTPKWVEVNIDGNIYNRKGIVEIETELSYRNVGKYAYNGRNLLLNSSFNKQLDRWGILGDVSLTNEEGSLRLLFPANTVSGIYQVIDLKGYEGDINVSFDAKAINTGWNNDLKIGIEDKAVVTGFGINDVSDWTRFVISLKLLTITNTCSFIFYKNDNSTPLEIDIRNLKVEKGNVSPWSPAPEDISYISIAGEIDEITGLTTNAEVLWEKL